MPNVMAALPNIGDALCSRRKVWLTPTIERRAVTLPRGENLLKFAGAPQTRQQISADSGPKFTILWGHVGRCCCLTFFPIIETCLSCEDRARQRCGIVHRRRIFSDFLRPVFSASPMQYVSDLRPKFALRPHHVWKYGGHPVCVGWE